MTAMSSARRDAISAESSARPTPFASIKYSLAIARPARSKITPSRSQISK